jgi:hypothetical protein
MHRSAEVEPLAGKIGTVARLIDGSPTTVKRLVNQGVLPPPFRLTPTGVPLWWMPDVKAKLADRAGRPLAA